MAHTDSSKNSGSIPDQSVINLNTGSKETGRIVLLTAIIGISFSLRAPITSIGSLAGLIHDDLGVSNGFIGFITTLPLIAFAVCSPFVSKVSDRLGIGRTMLFGLFAIVAGGVLRAYTGIAGLLIGTAVIGVGISASNVLIPSIVKLKFPDRIGIVTSIYISFMTLFASIGAGASYPLAESGLGWKSSSVVWTGIAVLAAVAWFPQRKLNDSAPKGTQPGHSKAAGRRNIWKSSLAWFITLYFGFQSFNYYSLTAWIPSILNSYGMTPMAAGFMALWFQLVGMLGAFTIPILASRVRDQRKIVAASCCFYLLGIVMLIAFRSDAAILIALFFLSNGGSASFGWAMVMFSLKAGDAEEAVKLSGMSQSVGYLMAAIGPTLSGVIFDRAGTWSLVLSLFLGTTVVMIVTGILASKKEKLF